MGSHGHVSPLNQIKQELSLKPPADFCLHPFGQSSVTWPAIRDPGKASAKEQEVGSIC